MTFEYTDYPFVRPPEMNGKGGACPVVILGGGPVGMAAALGLAKYGVPSIVLEAGNRVSTGSRAICISRRSLEILDRIGCGDAVADKGLWWTRGTSYYRKTPVFRLNMPHSADFKYPPFVNIQQYYLESFMLEQVLASDLIDYRWQSRVSELEQKAHGVKVTVATPEGNYRLRADYAVAADGARSAARDLLGLRLRGESYSGRYLIADIRLKTDLPVERRAWFDPAWNPGGTVLMHAQPDDIWRLDYQLRRDEDEKTELEEDRVRDRIQAHLDYIGERGDWTLEWRSVYSAYALLLDDYRAGRVFFAGDAAHLVPIFGVRGLNSGYEDAHNLVWKLAAVVNGQAADALLDSYSPERRGATEFTLAAATKSTRFMTPPSRGYEVMREAALSLAVSNTFVRELVNPRQSAPIGYADTPLKGADDRAARAGIARPGDCLPDALVQVSGAPVHLLDLLDGRFAVMYFTSRGEIAPGLEKEIVSLIAGGAGLQVLAVGWHAAPVATDPDIIPVHDRPGLLADRYGVPDGGVIILRPDGHVLGRLFEFDRARVQTLVNTCFEGGS